MRVKLHYIICFIILFSTFLFPAFSQDEQYGIIKGKITGDNEVLADASISAGNEDFLSDQYGEYSIKLAAGSYTMTVSYAGYQTVKQVVTIKAFETREVNFKLFYLGNMQEVVVLGSRSSIQRTSMNTSVPIDVIESRKLFPVPPELTQQLAIGVPSFNSPPQTVGVSAYINPATLRGLGPDETLVLLNGHRLHTGSTVFLQYSLGYGTVATDINTIPAAALEKIEVLRDGAAAQYGSDAVAGVINLQLKKATGKMSINLLTGETYKKDGQLISFDINRGFRLNKKGFLNFTVAARFNNATQRNGVYDSTVYYNIPSGASVAQTNSIRTLDNQMVAARGFDRLNSRRVGLPKILNNSLIINGGYPLNKNLNLFWTAAMNYRMTKDHGSSVYKYPKDTTTVNLALYPDGFQPEYVSAILDASLIAGIEGTTNNNWHWDISSIVGNNSLYTEIRNSNNASQFSLGKNVPTRFNPGTTAFTQNTNNLNFSKDFAKKIKAVKSLTVSFGGEFRTDQYKITQGDEASWKNYAPTSGRIGGSQGLGGYAPENAISKSRYITALYTELELDKNEKFLVNLAGRFEYYSDFKNNVAGKLAMRYKFCDQFLLRVSFSNGFRAPAIQQRYYSVTNQVTKFNQSFITGTYSNDGEVASAFGIAPLQPEKSLNVSWGIVSKISPNINLTLDAYWIQINNRIILTGLIQRSIATPAVGAILDGLGRTDITAVRFFTNAVSTRTKGIDLVLSGNWPVGKGLIETSLSANFNKTKIFNTVQSVKNLPDDPLYQEILLNPEERGRLEQSQPLDKIILLINYKIKKLEFSASAIHFGKAAHLFNGADRSRDEYFSPKILTGCLAGYSLTKEVAIKVGVRNMLNTYPDKLRNRANTQAGILIYDFNGTQIGSNGGYYFLSLLFNW